MIATDPKDGLTISFVPQTYTYINNGAAPSGFMTYNESITVSSSSFNQFWSQLWQTFVQIFGDGQGLATLPSDRPLVIPKTSPGSRTTEDDDYDKIGA